LNWIIAPGGRPLESLVMPDPTLRFAVGDSVGLSSNSWRVWAKRDDDVYIVCRDNYKELKVSLHGHRWRVGVTDVGAKATSPDCA
jgi:hypothetical protein